MQVSAPEVLLLDLRDRDAFEQAHIVNSVQVGAPEVLLLDLRDSDAFEQAHIVNAANYPARRLSHSLHCFDATILAFANRAPKRVIVVYDADERVAVPAARLFFEKGVDNVFVLTGALRIRSCPLTTTGFHQTHTPLRSAAERSGECAALFNIPIRTAQPRGLSHVFQRRTQSWAARTPVAPGVQGVSRRWRGGAPYSSRE